MPNTAPQTKLPPAVAVSVSWLDSAASAEMPVSTKSAAMPPSMSGHK